MNHTVIHDGQGTWFDPSVMQVSTLTDEQFSRLEDGEESVLTDDAEVGPDRITGFTGRQTETRDETQDELMRVMTLWLPFAELGEDNDGQLVIYTGLNDTGEGTLTPFQPEDAPEYFEPEFAVPSHGALERVPACGDPGPDCKIHEGKCD